MISSLGPLLKEREIQIRKIFWIVTRTRSWWLSWWNYKICMYLHYSVLWDNLSQKRANNISNFMLLKNANLKKYFLPIFIPSKPNKRKYVIALFWLKMFLSALYAFTRFLFALMYPIDYCSNILYKVTYILM